MGAEAPKKDDPEKVRGSGKLRASGENGQNTASEGPLLRLQRRQQRGQGGRIDPRRDGFPGP